jgi:starch synthase
MFLMPSRYEPSGLTQLYSLKYGTIPIVRATGGLKDSIEEFEPESGKGTGFCFEAYEPAALLAAAERAISFFTRKALWSRIMKNAMRADFSWSRSAREYLALYDRLVGRAL